jgi:replication factor C large subunit
LKDNFLWVEKYRPRRISDVTGNEGAKSAFTEWLKTKHRTRKSVLLYGPPGVGKTTMVNAAANEFGFNVIEMNASDARSEKAINAVAGPATSFVALDTFSTESKGSILFMDEVDGIAGNEDRGGVSAIVKIVEESRIPVIMAANNPDLEKLRPLKKVSTLIRFQQIRTPLIILMLKRICEKENIEAEFEALERIAENSGGDARSAINDLQSLAETSRRLTLQDTAILTYRNKDISMDETLLGYFSARSLMGASTLLSRSSVDYDDLLMAISDNLPNRYSDPQNLGAAYDLISKADIFRGRIGTENWHLLKYFYNSLSEAAAISPDSYRPFTLISPPIRVMALFWTKGKRTTLAAICAKIGQRCHVSRNCAKEDFIPFLRLMISLNKAHPVLSWLGLGPDEIDFLSKMNKL